MDKQDGYICECQDGWEGVNCESSKLETVNLTQTLNLRLSLPVNLQKVGSGDPQRWNQLKLRMKSEGLNLANTAYAMDYIKSRMKLIKDVTTGYDRQ